MGKMWRVGGRFEAPCLCGTVEAPVRGMPFCGRSEHALRCRPRWGENEGHAGGPGRALSLLVRVRHMGGGGPVWPARIDRFHTAPAQMSGG